MIDVFELATSIRNDCQQFMDSHGSDSLVEVLPKIVSILEELENYQEGLKNEEEEKEHLKEKIDILNEEKMIQLREKDYRDQKLDYLEKNYFQDTKEILSRVSQLENENKKLLEDLEERNQTSQNFKKEEIIEDNITAGKIMKSIAEGKRPSYLLNSEKFKNVIDETTKRLLEVKSKDYTGIRSEDISLISKLKECSLHNSNLIRELRKERLQLIAMSEAAHMDADRLATVHGRLLGEFMTSDQSIEQLQEKNEEISEKIKSIQKELDEFDFNKLEEVSLPLINTRITSCSKFFANQSQDLETLQNKLFDIYSKITELKLLQIEIGSHIKTIEEVKIRELEEKFSVLYGPIPKEPREKFLYHKRKNDREKFVIQSVFKNILSKIVLN